MAKELRHKTAGVELTLTEDDALDRHYMTGGASNDILVYDSATGTLIGKTLAEIMALLSGQAAADFAMNSRKITGVAAPVAAGDAAILSTVTDHTALTTAHGAVSTATASKIVVRDAEGQAAFAAPAAAGDALIKGTRVTAAEMLDGTSGFFLKAQGASVDPVYATITGLPIVARKTADQIVNNSTVLVNVTDMLFPVAANEIWGIWLVIRHVRAASGAQNTKIGFTWPTGGSVYFGTGYFATQNETAADPGFSNITGGTVVKVFQAYFYYIGGANAGNVQFQFAQSVAEAIDHTIKMNSHIIAHRIA